MALLTWRTSSQSVSGWLAFWVLVAMTTDAGASSELCPEGYKAISQNLDGFGKVWSDYVDTRTKDECAGICNARSGCTGFEFAEGGRNQGECATYTGGNLNIMAERQRLEANSDWRSCMRKPTVCNGEDSGCCTSSNPCGDDEGDCDSHSDCKPGLVCGKDNCSKKSGAHWDATDDCCTKPKELCPEGYKAISQNLDGFGKVWSDYVDTRTKDECAGICNARSGCTGFEFAEPGGWDQGDCATYTGGDLNIMAERHRLEANSEWRSCMRKPTLNKGICGWYKSCPGVKEDTCPQGTLEKCRCVKANKKSKKTVAKGDGVMVEGKCNCSEFCPQKGSNCKAMLHCCGGEKNMGKPFAKAARIGGSCN